MELVYANENFVGNYVFDLTWKEISRGQFTKHQPARQQPLSELIQADL